MFEKGTQQTKSLASAESIREWLVVEVANRLGVPASELDANTPLQNYGLGSRDATTLSGELGRRLGRKLSPVLLWDYPTIGALSRHLAGEHVERATLDDEFSEESA